jgi:hypothetical protein
MALLGDDAGDAAIVTARMTVPTEDGRRWRDEIGVRGHGPSAVAGSRAPV